MQNIEALRRRIDRIIRRYALQRLPRTWISIQTTEQETPPELLAQISPRDLLVIHEIPVGYLVPPLEKPAFYSFQA